MGKGIAVTFREKWPLMYARYRELCETGNFILGDIFEWTDGATTIYNLGTQRIWRSKADVSSIRISMARLSQLLIDAGISEIYMPRIGAGLGGLIGMRLSRSLNRILVRVTLVYISATNLSGVTLQARS